MGLDFNYSCMEGRRSSGQRSREGDEFEQKIVELSRVTRVTKGGKQMRFRACVAVGNRKGSIGAGVAKGQDVAQAIAKATTQAKKHMVILKFPSGTIPFPVWHKYGAARIIMRAAPRGTGIKAGGPMRSVLELAGVPNVVGKMMGSKNKINNVRATLEALEKFVV